MHLRVFIAAHPMASIDFLSCLVSDELTTRGGHLLKRRRRKFQAVRYILCIDTALSLIHI